MEAEATLVALTKVELGWPEHPDPMVEGRRLAERVMTAPGARRVLFDVRPVASLVGAAAATFTDDDYADLVALSTVDADLLEKRLRRGPYFATRDYDDIPVPAQRQARLLRRFGQYALALAAGLSPRDRMTMLDALAPLLSLDHNEHAFKELDVLRHFYDGKLTFTDADAADLLRVTGEHGTSVADRLGLPTGATRDELAAAARQRLGGWAERDLDPSYAGRSRRAVQVLRRSYERLVGRIDQERAGVA